MTILGDWRHDCADIPAQGLAVERSATESERSGLATALNLLALDELAARYRVTPLAGGGYRLAGRLVSNLTQPCVVTLEPVGQSIDEPFEVEFWSDVLARDESEEASVLGGGDLELLDNGVIPVGRIVFETLSAALDPYPRKEGAEFVWREENGGDSGKTSPFAVLSRLKDRKGG